MNLDRSTFYKLKFAWNKFAQILLFHLPSKDNSLLTTVNAIVMAQKPFLILNKVKDCVAHWKSITKCDLSLSFCWTIRYSIDFHLVFKRKDEKISLHDRMKFLRHQICHGIMDFLFELSSVYWNINQVERFIHHWISFLE